MNALKRPLIRRVHFSPLAPRFGGGRTGIITAAAAKTALFAIINAVVLCFSDIGTPMPWIASTALMFLATLGSEVVCRWAHRH